MPDIRRYEPLWGSWRVESMIGRGAYSKVYKVRREAFDKVHYSAVKIISIPQDDSEIRLMKREGLDEAAMRSFFKTFAKNIITEIDLISQFRGNSHIVSIEDYQIIEEKTDTIGWDILIRMELLTSLADHVVMAPLSENEIIKLGIHICRALELCALKDIIHRDINPDNIFISPYGDYKLGDFGLARQIDRTSQMTKKGTNNYMAPEVFRDEPYGASVDTYSLGIVMYSLLNQNRTPFLPNYPQAILPGDRVQAVQSRMNGEPMPNIEGVDSRLNSVVLKACAFDRLERFSGPAEMRKVLESLPPSRRHWTLVLPGDQAAHRSLDMAAVKTADKTSDKTLDKTANKTAGTAQDGPRDISKDSMTTKPTGWQLASEDGRNQPGEGVRASNTDTIDRGSAHRAVDEPNPAPWWEPKQRPFPFPPGPSGDDPPRPKPLGEQTNPLSQQKEQSPQHNPKDSVFKNMDSRILIAIILFGVVALVVLTVVVVLVINSTGDTVPDTVTRFHGEPLVMLWSRYRFSRKEGFWKGVS
ncbi:MAG: protein kinase [Peptococcaceae bacterium]|nr:protein kinase [Peptococcaceae bacterium]